MEQEKKPHVNIGSIGHVGCGKSDLNSAIETLLKEPHMSNRSFSDYVIESRPSQRMPLSEQIMKKYEQKSREEEMKWLEEIGYYDDLDRKFKQVLAERKEKENQETISEK